MGKVVVKIPDKMTDSEKKKIKQANKAKANPQLTAEKQKKKAARGSEMSSSVVPVINDD